MREARVMSKKIKKRISLVVRGKRGKKVGKVKEENIKLTRKKEGEKVIKGIVIRKDEFNVKGKKERERMYLEKQK